MKLIIDSSGKVQTILIMVIVPLIFALIVGGILAQLFGIIDLPQWVEGIPVVGGLLPASEEEPQMTDREDELDRWAEELSVLQNELEEERRDLEAWEDELEEMEASLQEKENELQELENELMAEEETLIDREERLESLAQTYEEMRPAEAAEILEDLEDELLINILDRLPDSHKARILSEMNSNRAREITRLLGS